MLKVSLVQQAIKKKILDKTLFALFKILFIKKKIFPGFVEMMSAYFPDFSQIQTGKVCEWIFELANETSKKKNSVETKTSESILT